MPTEEASQALFRFGPYEFLPETGELRRNGTTVRLAPQPGRVLSLLLQSRGRLVERSELQAELWDCALADVDRSLNVCIAQLRAALRDRAEAPTYIKTVPRRGYQFVGPVGGTGRGQDPPEQRPAGRTSRWWLWAAAAVVVVAAAGLSLWGWRARPAPVRIAVLPFALTGDQTLRVFQSGLLDELMSQLGTVPPERLLVTGRGSVMEYEGREASTREVREKLGADYLIEGSVRRSGGQLRVTARLVDARRDAQLRSWTFEAEMAQMGLKRDIGSQVSGKVFELLFTDAEHGADYSEQCKGCWEPLRNARYLQAKGTEEAFRQSTNLFEEASRIEQKCDRAWSGMAESLVALARRNGEGVLFERARRAAQEALRRNPRNAEALQALANVYLWRDWDWRESERLLRRAVEESPASASAHHDLAWYLVTAGRRSEAVASLRRAIAMDPLSARVNLDAGWIYLQAHEFEEAAKQARRAMELEPELREAQACLARALLYQGKHAEAWAAMRALAPVGFKEPRNATDAIVQLFRQTTADRSGNPYFRAVRLAWLGESEAAVEAVEEAVRNRVPAAAMLRSEPAFVGLWASARFRMLMEKVGR
ncbi:MAG: winged helix-turn-helix domain-containing protein [Bryobacteraceae bacterium]|nr:winged helix-turn-helix domain-containing protein [Bryobacteraceae bacterium]